MANGSVATMLDPGAVSALPIIPIPYLSPMGFAPVSITYVSGMNAYIAIFKVSIWGNGETLLVLALCETKTVPVFKFMSQ